MRIQTVFKAGNSNVVAIPKNLSEELQIKPGQKVRVEKSSDEDAIIIRKTANSKTAKTKPITKEFKNWLDKVLEEDKEIFDELANR